MQITLHDLIFTVNKSYKTRTFYRMEEKLVYTLLYMLDKTQQQSYYPFASHLSIFADMTDVPI